MKNEQKLRVFSPVILFHDHQVIKGTSSESIPITYGDPFHHDDQNIELHKRRISRMLEHNGRFWSDIITWSRDHALVTDHSPVPSLVSSPTPPLQSRELPSPKQSPPPLQRRHQSKNKSATTVSAGSTLATKSSVTCTIKPDSKTNKRRRGNLPKAVTTILRDWLSDHKKHPYPTEEEKDTLARRTGLTLNQISNWFINARRRILQPMLEQQVQVNEKRQNELDTLSHVSHSSDDPTDRRLRKRHATEAFDQQGTVSSSKRINSRRRS
ncbi:hypothetical protein BC941DRAFT_435184 [Chlamydoabsidia padenii]|nr:hypothetical protein BC941DRAFT_435184 [Chlamydoabsidia padenii]